MPEALAAVRFAHFAAVCCLFGFVAFPFYAGDNAGQHHRMAGWALVWSVLTFLTGVVELLVMAGSMGGAWSSALDLQTVGSAISDTAFGRVLVCRLGVAVIVVGLCLRAGAKRSPLLLVGSAGLLGSIALTGHSAMPGGALGVLHRIADLFHLLGAGWWIGGLFALLLNVSVLGERLPFTLGRFSRVGYSAVAAIVISGIFKTLVLVTPLSALATSLYGWLLLLKLAAFSLMGVLALSNRLQVAPALAERLSSRWGKRLALQVSAELLLGLAVLLIVGVLGSLSPPISS